MPATLPPLDTPADAGRSGPLFPRVPLLLIGAALIGSLLWVASLRLAGVSPREPDAPAVAQRLLRFEDGPGGSVLVRDHASGETVVMLVGEQGFVRGALRALARERKLGNVAGAEQPFALIGRADGRLTLQDPVTGQRVDLESFGPQHAAEFGRLLRPADRLATPAQE